MAIFLAYMITASILALSFGLVPTASVYAVAIVATGIATIYALTSSMMMLAR